MTEPENKLPPAFAWSRKDWPSETAYSQAGVLEAWCYTDRFSYYPGDEVRVHGSSNAPEFSITILRDSANPTTILEQRGLHAEHLPAPKDAYASGCNWPVVWRWTIPQDLASGFFLIVIRTTQANGEIWEREHFFVVKAPAARAKR